MSIAVQRNANWSLTILFLGNGPMVISVFSDHCQKINLSPRGRRRREKRVGKNEVCIEPEVAEMTGRRFAKAVLSLRYL